MMEHEQERMQKLLRKTMLPVAAQVNTELRRDLWPAMLKRLEARPAKVPWFDWALLAAVAVWLVFSPGAIPLLLYYL
jgi:hypothetical protein